MSRLVAYMGSDAESLKAALQEHREILCLTVPISEKADAESVASWGLGFYQGGEVLLQKRPRVVGSAVDLSDSLKELRTDAILAQIRIGGSSKLAKNENTPPFRFRSWIMVHQGATPEFDRLREPLLALLPDFLRRNIRGQTESEHLFHLFLACLHESGRSHVEDANLPPELALRALVQMIGRFADLASRTGSSHADGPAPCLIGLTNGRSLIVSRLGADPIWLLRFRGVPGNEQFRGVLLASGLGDVGEGKGTEEVPSEHAVLVGRDLVPRIVPLREAQPATA